MTTTPVEQRAALEYLGKFGYVTSEAVAASAAQPSAELLRVSLREFQTMAQIPVTGELDQATVEAMARPRCGFPDRAPTPLEGTHTGEFVAFGTRWPQAIITYGVEGVSPDLDGARQRQILREGFEQWSAVVPLVFREVPAHSTPDILIRFVTGSHGPAQDPAFDGVGTVLAHAFFPPPNAGLLAGDVHFDEDETWQDGLSPNGFDLLTVTVHELGHALGLLHTTVPSSTMNPFYPTPTPPQADDRDGVRSVYREHVWVASLYRDVLGRPFDEAGLDGWVRSRFAGATTEGIARGFCYSHEFANAMATDLYKTLLDRDPDPGGLAFWTDLLRNGTSRQAVITGFLESSEYLMKHPAPENFVTSLYARLLGRSPDPGGFAYWVSQMNQGASPADVAFGFLHSDEYARNLSREQYRKFLLREPDAGGWRYWTDQVKAGLAHQGLIVGFVTSPEYRNLTTTRW